MGLEDIIFVVQSTNKKPIKMVHNEMVCPISLQIGDDWHCKYAETKIDNGTFNICCSNIDKCERYIFED